MEAISDRFLAVHEAQRSARNGVDNEELVCLRIPHRVESALHRDLTRCSDMSVSLRQLSRDEAVKTRAHAT